MTTPTITFQNSTKLLKFRASPFFKTVLDTSSCLNAIVEIKIERDILDMIHMTNDNQMLRKHLHLIVPALNKNTYQNLTLNYDVTFEIKVLFSVSDQE